MKADTLTVSEVARQLGVRPTAITSVFYDRRVADSSAPIVAGRRRIPPSLVPDIRRVLETRGQLIAPIDMA